MAKSAPVTKLKLNLNLLFPQGTPQKLPVRFLRWLLSYGRFLAVVVEIVVLLTFVFQFKLDQDLSNLNESINQQVSYIQSLSPQEALIKQTQFKLTTVRNIYASNGNWQQVLQKIAAQEPTNIKLSTINLTRVSPTSPNLQFKISGQATNNVDLAIFLGGLKQEKSFKNITLTNISFDQGIISFAITGESS